MIYCRCLIAKACPALCNPMNCTRLPSPLPSLRACSNSRPLSRWCHPTISSSIVPLTSCLQSFSASESFPMSQFFASDGPRIGASASALVFPMNIQGWLPLRLTGLLSLQSTGLSRVSSSTAVGKHPFFSAQPSCFQLTSICGYWKNHGVYYMDLRWQSAVSAF